MRQRHIESVAVEMDLLGEVGFVPLTAKAARASLERIRTTLDERIMARLAPAMSAAQREELELLEREDADGVIEHFLDRQMPGHREVAAEELAKLKAELSACAAIDRALSQVLPVYHDAFARLDAEQADGSNSG